VCGASKGCVRRLSNDDKLSARKNGLSEAVTSDYQNHFNTKVKKCLRLIEATHALGKQISNDAMLTEFWPVGMSDGDRMYFTFGRGRIGRTSASPAARENHHYRGLPRRIASLLLLLLLFAKENKYCLSVCFFGHVAK
jgi:hypothetical protein